MAKHNDITTYHVTYLDETFGLRTLTFNSQETADEFCNTLLQESCAFVHLYKNVRSTILFRDEECLYVSPDK